MTKPKLLRRLMLDSADWIGFFSKRAVDVPELPWSQRVRLTEEERERVLPSIAIFQLGESGEGRHLFRAAQDWARRSGDDNYVTALKLFIGEEHRHAGMLGRYLDLAGYPRLVDNWTDGIFRRLRKFAGLELAITVLLTAELVAMVYYAALRRASGCPLLRAICRQVLDDECGHIRFQSQQLGRLRAEQLPWRAAISAAFHPLLLASTSVVVWWTHGPVLKTAGLTYAKFLSKLWGQHRASATIIRSMRASLSTKAETASVATSITKHPRPCPA